MQLALGSCDCTIAQSIACVSASHLFLPLSETTKSFKIFYENVTAKHDTLAFIMIHT